ncbi:hypothetical protein HK102_004070 [Quaeritorhiza haematococci]|nr:hypothetical protein HK102_004070 [Quaeritorhiza haematococci]
MSSSSSTAATGISTSANTSHTDPPFWSIEPSGLGNIGLQNAVNAALDQIPPRKWVGTLGESTNGFSEELKSSIARGLDERHDCLPVFITDEEADGHYNQFCKQILWKPFHYQLSDYPKGTAYEEKSWRLYVAVNQRFAQVIADNYRPGDVVWVNDYHLMLVPAMVRQIIPNAIIGFFLHIPFPSSEIFRCLHVRKQILEGLLGADLVGFQTSSFMRHFLMTCTRLLAVESSPRGIQLDNTRVSVGIFPIGINMISLNQKRNLPEVPEMIASLREKYAGKKVLIGRDKADYVKGLRQKMLSYERFLAQHPEWHGKVVLIQVVLSTTEANENECQVSDVVARINSRFGTIEHLPVVYLHQDISFSHYLALLTIADCCLITSLRDGMNLTSHEYVVCQEGKHSPLIISEFAGTYGNFGAALRVNPWDTGEVADAIQEALTMSEEEKVARWRELRSYITTNTAQKYVTSFVNEVQRVHEELQETASTSIPLLPFDMVYDEYEKSNKRLLFIDHDGTITPAAMGMASDDIDPKMIAILTRLVKDPRNIVYLMSGRRKDDLKEFMKILGLGISAESGAFLKYADSNKWETMLDDVDISWKKPVLEIFEYYTDRTPGSFIEQRDLSVVWHYGLADLNFGSWQAAECQNHIEQSIGATYPIHAMAKKKSVVVFPRNVNKGFIIRRVLDYHRMVAAASRRRRLSSAGATLAAATQAGVLAAMGVAAAADAAADGSSATTAGGGQAGGQAGDVNYSKLHQPQQQWRGRLRSEGAIPTSAIAGGESGSATGKDGGPLRTLSRKPSELDLEHVDFIFAIGDDRSDEYMFEYLNRTESRRYNAFTNFGVTGVVGSPIQGESGASTTSTTASEYTTPRLITTHQPRAPFGSHHPPPHGSGGGAIAFGGGVEQQISPLPSPAPSPLPSPHHRPADLPIPEQPYDQIGAGAGAGAVGSGDTSSTSSPTDTSSPLIASGRYQYHYNRYASPPYSDSGSPPHVGTASTGTTPSSAATTRAAAATTPATIPQVTTTLSSLTMGGNGGAGAVVPLRRRVFITCTVGSKSSAAKWYLRGVSDVKALLEGLAMGRRIGMPMLPPVADRRA